MKPPSKTRRPGKVSLVKHNNKKYSKAQKSKKGRIGFDKQKLNMGAKGNLPKNLQNMRRGTNNNHRPTEEEDDAGGGMDENDVSDMVTAKDERYLNHFATTGFLESVSRDSCNKPKQKGKRKRMEEESKEATFESLPRKFQSNADGKQFRNLLPIKGKKGLVPQFLEVEPDMECDDEDDENEEEDEEESPTTEVEDALDLEQYSAQELLAIRRQKIESYKFKIAHLSSSITENPQENLSQLAELKSMLSRKDPLVHLVKQKMLMLSLLEVFKDIIPGYKIRSKFEQEEDGGIKLSKDTKVLLNFENSLVKHYKEYLLSLESVSQVLIQSRKKKRNSEPTSKTDESLAEVAIECLCQLLLSHPHFNFTTNIIISLVPFAASSNENVTVMCCNTFRMMFKQDKLGAVSLEAVKAITKLIKERSYNVPPQVLETFLCLKIQDISVKNMEDEKVNRMTHKEKLLKMSRREYKNSKRMKELDSQLEETSASESKQKKMKFQTDILKQVFLTYFRILKKGAFSVLLSSVLEGLAKFAHLINVEFFDDLIAVLHQLIKSKVLDYRQSLHCIQTVVTILSGQGEALNIDPMRFYTHLYTSLFALHAGTTNDDFAVAVRCLDSLIIKRRKQVSFQRVLAFTKRLCTLSLQLHHHGTIAALALVRNFLKNHSRADILLDTESSQSSSGIFMPELEEPEHCNANATSLWELFPLQRHYHPVVRKFASNIGLGIPTDGNGQLAQDLSRSSPSDLFINFHPNETDFNPPMLQSSDQAGMSKKHKNARNHWTPVHCQDFEDMMATLEKLDVTNLFPTKNGKNVKNVHERNGVAEK